MSCWISLALERAVVDAHLVDQPREPLAPDAVAAKAQRPRSTPPSTPTNGSRARLTPRSRYSRTTDPSNVVARCDHAFNGNAARPDRIPLATDVHLTQRPAARLIRVQPVDDAARTLLEDHRPPPTQPSTAAPTPPPSSPTSDRAKPSRPRSPSRSPRRSSTPSRTDPHALHTAPDTVPAFPRPDASTATRPGARVEPVRRHQAGGRSALHERRRVGRRRRRCREASGPPHRRRTRTGRPTTLPIRRSAQARRRRSCTPARTSASSARCRSSRRRRRCGRLGCVANVRLTFFGSTSRVTVVVTPAESVAVSWISR